MTRRNPSGPLLFDSEIKSTTRRNHKEERQIRENLVVEREEIVITEEMGDNENNQLPPAVVVDPDRVPRTMYDYAKPILTGSKSGTVRPTETMEMCKCTQSQQVIK
ncbi:hypothetical protein PVK06_040721 [Gossypium arboreum]|uniref:Uncharacterized protein n=1 Tax=Gossypium arboreum TaxID=29729 RepID=A0ABR0N6F0_GOSAR|nr:hypothetical protein PVK06_040721 [Gossypium arboreum]